ncbi:hypothetical protein [Pseudoclavibacter terrae]|uniref:hypothetical protein n=1 Tax=Pseudoclavibacter terrae TaxID=1530195 RepID=UPI00232AC154|nr:hypothetical protein [Pseudoclavibacter terrae]
MELIGKNADSSGLYRIYRDKGAMVTYTGSSEDELFELARQPLIANDTYTAQSENDWSTYGTNDHQCDVHFQDPFVRIDGVTYELGPDIDSGVDTPVSAAELDRA